MCENPLPTYIEEWFSIRLMRHVYHFDSRMSLSDWVQAQEANGPSGGGLVRHYTNQYLLTRVPLLEMHRFEHLSAKVKRKAFSPEKTFGAMLTHDMERKRKQQHRDGSIPGDGIYYYRVWGEKVIEKVNQTAQSR